jgi:hypothetical protein
MHSLMNSYVRVNWWLAVTRRSQVFMAYSKIPLVEWLAMPRVNLSECINHKFRFVTGTWKETLLAAVCASYHFMCSQYEEMSQMLQGGGRYGRISSRKELNTVASLARRRDSRREAMRIVEEQAGLFIQSTTQDGTKSATTARREKAKANEEVQVERLISKPPPIGKTTSSSTHNIYSTDVMHTKSNILLTITCVLLIYLLDDDVISHVGRSSTRTKTTASNSSRNKGMSKAGTNSEIHSTAAASVHDSTATRQSGTRVTLEGEHFKEISTVTEGKLHCIVYFAFTLTTNTFVFILKDTRPKRLLVDMEPQTAGSIHH